MNWRSVKDKNKKDKNKRKMTQEELVKAVRSAVLFCKEHGLIKPEEWERAKKDKEWANRLGAECYRVRKPLYLRAHPSEEVKK